MRSWKITIRQTHSEMLDRWNSYITKLKITLLPYQQELASSLLQLPHTAKVTQCRQSGKSFILGLVAYFLMYTNRWDIVITAPKLEQTWAIMKYVHRIQNRFKPRTEYNNRYSIALKRGGSVICLSGREEADVEGPSAHIVIVDEHQDIKASHVSETFVPMLSWHSGLYWSCGIGGAPGSVAQRAKVEFEWTLPYQDVITVKPDYQRTVDLAREEMLPEEFDAHYGCLPLDISGKLLIPHIQSYTPPTVDVSMTVIGIDWGKRIDRTVATVVQTAGAARYISEWRVSTGSYDEQMDDLVHWLKNDVNYDYIIPEANGVGDSNSDFLIRAMKDPRGFDSGIIPIDAKQSWITDRAKEINKRALNGTLVYNKEHNLSGVFRKEISAVEYKMVDSKHIKLPSSGQPGHSDFLPSLMLAMEEPSAAYV